MFRGTGVEGSEFRPLLPVFGLATFISNMAGIYYFFFGLYDDDDEGSFCLFSRRQTMRRLFFSFVLSVCVCVCAGQEGWGVNKKKFIFNFRLAQENGEKGKALGFKRRRGEMRWFCVLI